MIRTRIAPSPTGNLHIGTARTALFNYLFAKKMGGKFIVRIEDTDLERSEKKFEKNILEGLEWLGLKADESPAKGGDFGPYRQSERTTSYKLYINQLLKDGHAFYCFHSEKDLEEEKNNLFKAKRPLIHICEYRQMALAEAEILKEAKGDCLIRFKNHPGRKVTFQDLIRGELSFDTDLLGDFSLAKREDIPLYNFAVVVDDHEMEITHVIRGEDHLTNTPKQIVILEALGFSRPAYAHLPMILGTDRSKMSKRHGATSVEEYRQLGYLPEAMLNFMALLGWNPGEDREILSLEEIINFFSLERVQKSGAVFDLAKLDWMNGEYIRKKSVEELVELVKPFLAGFLQGQRSKVKSQKDHLKKVVALEQPRLKRLSEIIERAGYFFKEPDYEAGLLRWKEMNDGEIKDSLEKSLKILDDAQKSSAGNLEKIFLEEASRGGDRGKLLWPLRAALSGQKASAGPFEIINILGIEETRARIQRALNKLP